MVNLQELDYEEFEILVGLLLKSEGHQIVRSSESRFHTGPDYETISPEGNSVVVEVKHYKRGVSKSLIHQFAGDLDRYRQQNENIKGLLVISSELTNEALLTAQRLTKIEIWDASRILTMLSNHPEVSPIFESLQRRQTSFKSTISSLMGMHQSRADELCAKLHKIPCGINDWRVYEKVCTEILTYIFTPHLAAPDIQSRSDDGLDIIDAIFPIRSQTPPWSTVRAEFRTRFVVAEFKNNCDPIGQSQVESIAQYLWQPAQRVFGLLISRDTPSRSAVLQRRRMWLEQAKMIVFLTDESLCEMLQLKDSKNEPYDVIDTQLEDFLRTLTP